jgi:transcriptional regulator with XRE-family HTH domain
MKSTISTEKQKVLMGRHLRSLRTARSLTQQALGERADVHYKFIGEVERGERFPSAEILFKLAAALELAPRDLLTFEHELTDRKELLAAITGKLGKAGDQDLRLIHRLVDAVLR